MKKGSVVKSPISAFIKRMKDKNENTYYSFFANKSEKNKDTEEWSIVERYVINVMNIEVLPESEYEIEEIIEAKPATMKDKSGKEYLNCLLWVNAKCKQQEQNNNNNSYQVNDDSDDDLPF